MLNKILYVLSAGFFASIIYKNYPLLYTIPENLLKANLFLILIALFIQVIKHLALSYNFYLNFKKSGVSFSFSEVVKATFVYIYVCVSTPFVGAGGLLAFIHFAGHKNESKIKVGSGAFLALLGDYLGFFLLIVLSVIFYRSSVEDFPLNYIFALLIFGATLLTIVFLSIFMKNFLTALLKLLQNTANFLTNLTHKKIYFDEKWAARNVELAHECFVGIRKDPKFYLKIILLGLCIHLLNMASFYIIGLSFKENLSSSKVVSSYIVLNTLETVSPTPNGIGIIESFVPEYMSRIGINFSTSFVLVTFFRFIYFYIPLFIGFYLSYKIFNHKENS